MQTSNKITNKFAGLQKSKKLLIGLSLLLSQFAFSAPGLSQAPVVNTFNGRDMTVVLESSDVNSALTSGSTLSLIASSGNNMVISPGGAGTTLNFGSGTFGIGSIAKMSYGSGSTSSSLQVYNILQAQYYRTFAGTFTEVSGTPLTPILSIVANWNGTVVGTPIPYSSFSTPSDQIDASGAQGNPVNLESALNYGGGSESGGRSGFRSSIGTIGTVGGSNAMSTAGEFWNSASNNMGGTASLPSGSVYGINPQTTVGPGATYLELANALGEADMSVAATQQPIVVTGSTTSGDVVNVVLTSSEISGSPITISYTVGASGSTPEALTNVIYGLNALINTDSPLYLAGVSSAVIYNSSTNALSLNINWPLASSVSVTTSVSGSGSEVLTVGSVVAGASVNIKAGGTIIRASLDTSSAKSVSYALGFAAQGGGAAGGGTATPAAGWQYGLALNNGGSGSWSFYPQATLIGAMTQKSVGSNGNLGNKAPQLAMFGIDLSNVTFL